MIGANAVSLIPHCIDFGSYFGVFPETPPAAGIHPSEIGENLYRRRVGSNRCSRAAQVR
jgi:hypothetical protein